MHKITRQITGNSNIEPIQNLLYIYIFICTYIVYTCIYIQINVAMYINLKGHF